MQLREGVLEGGNLMLSPSPPRLGFEANGLRAAFAIESEHILLEILSNAGFDRFEARATGAALTPFEGPSGIAGELGLRVAATLDMETASSEPSTAYGVRLEPDAVARSLRISDGIEGWRAQRLDLDRGAAAVDMPTVRGKRYVLTGYARVLTGRPEVVIRGSDSRFVWSSSLAPEVGWTAFMSPPFPSEGSTTTLTFQYFASWSADLDGLALLELPTPVCVQRGVVTCELRLPL